MPVVTVDHLSFRYPQGVEALRDVTFTVEAGESVGLVGANGAGKTTLFLCLAGVLTFGDHHVRIAQLNPAVASDRLKLPGHLGLVFQNSDDQLFHTNVLEDVAFGPLNLGLSKQLARERAETALRAVGLDGRDDRVPHQLSAGEKRRVALAGVLAMQPEIILFDEPTSSLDPRGRREFIKIMRNLAGARIVASHDLDMILECCPRVIVLDQGQIVADGLTSELLANRDLMEQHGLEVPFRLQGP